MPSPYKGYSKTHLCARQHSIIDQHRAGLELWRCTVWMLRSE